MATERDNGHGRAGGRTATRCRGAGAGCWCCLVLCALAGPAHAAADALDGRYRADYQSLTGVADFRRLQQQVDVSTRDHLFGANELALYFTGLRYSDLDRGLHANSQRWRMRLTGTAYTLTGVLAPRGSGLYGAQTSGEETRDVQLLWTYTPTRLPVLSASYRRNENFHAGDADPFSRSTERTVQLNHELGPLTLQGSWRDLEHRGGDAGGRRDQTTWQGLVRGERTLRRGLRADFTLNYLDTETEEGASDRRVDRTTNVMAGLSWTARPNLTASLRAMNRHASARSDSTATSLNREVALQVQWRPTREWQVNVRRDIRKVEQGPTSTYSDYVRCQAGWYGRLRSRLRGRWNLVKHVGVSLRNLSLPADETDLTLESPVFRRTTLRTTLQVSRRSGEVSSRLGRYSIQKTVDLRARLLRRLDGNLTWRSTNNSRSLVLSGSDNSGTTVGLSYAGARGLTWSANYRRSRSVGGDGRVRTADAWNGNLDLRLGRRLSCSISGTHGTSADGAGGEIATESYYARITYRVGPGTTCNVGWSGNRREGAQRVSSVTASYATVF